MTQEESRLEVKELSSAREIYELFEKAGDAFFATLDDGYPNVRVAQMIAGDEGGLYVRAESTKPFYKQMAEGGRISVCGMYGPGTLGMGENGLPVFEPGYTIRVVGDCREVSPEEVREKAQHDEGFALCQRDVDRYPTTRAICIHRFRADLYDYDYERATRPNKLERRYYSFGGFPTPDRAMRIDQDACTGCGACEAICADFHFHAIAQGEDGAYAVDPVRCSACGNCTTVCPADAIVVPPLA